MSNDRPNAWPPGNQGGWPASGPAATPTAAPAPAPAATPAAAPADSAAAWQPRTAGTGPLQVVPDTALQNNREPMTIPGPPAPPRSGPMPAAPAYGAPPQIRTTQPQSPIGNASPFEPTVTSHAAPQPVAAAVAAPIPLQHSQAAPSPVPPQYSQPPQYAQPAAPSVPPEYAQPPQQQYAQPAAPAPPAEYAQPPQPHYTQPAVQPPQPQPQYTAPAPAPVLQKAPPRPAQHPLEAAYSVVERIRARVRAAVRGRDEVVELVIMAMLADGHVLLEDFPGSGKTTLAKALGDALEAEQRTDHIVAMRRVQFTPDLLPSDITGTTIFDPATNQFYFRPGPVFAHILLADEINRTSPKVQAALLEAMGEKQATIDNTTHRLDDLFFVIATQNPLDLAGTFPLPSAQLDRFLFKIRMTHIDKASELDVLHSIRERRDSGAGRLPRVNRDEVVAARKAIEQNIHVAPEVLETLVDIAAATRADERILLGVSTRSLVLAVPALQARALSLHRGFVSPEDIEALAVPLFAHRMEMAPGIDDTAAVIRECIRGPLEALARKTFKR